jgi:hypothetical protein
VGGDAAGGQGVVEVGGLHGGSVQCPVSSFQLRRRIFARGRGGSGVYIGGT